ncbi:hypothetical protein M2222_005025 [Bradyrhizobium elkanii]|nr:hypothetical protein [Bradyrhizobium elkanii]MCS3562703.1 hypothetical protein [Bradyrhizobium elkanii]MCW2147460.1 hypothetical protein [Bradyrhizobium elkanii]MCW2353456.1 hypothetical protein [Bradyrhizobium elkanii]MCW2371187.1 hypothetical protein [Bradyrhizobium elkanii]
MDVKAVLPPRGRDYRLDLLRGFANWAIYLDHIPNNAVNWITQKNFGFSDAADLFVFISGYTASFVYARMMLERGTVIGATRLIKRAWQIYVACPAVRDLHRRDRLSLPALSRPQPAE